MIRELVACGLLEAVEGWSLTLSATVLPQAGRAPGAALVTPITARECWSTGSFKNWSRWGFEVMICRKGGFEAWPGKELAEQTSRDCATRDVTYKLTELPFTLSMNAEFGRYAASPSTAARPRS